MRLTRRGRAAAEAAALLAAARAGDDVALAVLRTDLSPATVTALAEVLGLDDLPDDVPAAAAVVALARQALERATRRDAVVRVLLDGERLTAARVAELLAVGPEVVEQARAEVLSRVGCGPRTAACRAWLLVGRPDRLTPAERAAADAHTDSCRPCRTALRVAGRAA